MQERKKIENNLSYDSTTTNGLAVVPFSPLAMRDALVRETAGRTAGHKS